MEEKNTMNATKKSVLDWAISAVVLAVLVVCYFFWGCNIDLWVTVLCLALLVAGTVLLQMQDKKLKEKEQQ